MRAIVPEPIERYLADLNRQPDSVLKEIAQEGREAELPLVDAEVGGLLRVRATAVRATRILEIGRASVPAHGHRAAAAGRGVNFGETVRLKPDTTYAPYYVPTVRSVRLQADVGNRNDD